MGISHLNKNNVFNDVMKSYGNTWNDYGSFGFKFNDDISTIGKFRALSKILGWRHAAELKAT